MTKGGKGRISNTLVAASCAAVLTVYAAGYWRTRAEARRMDVRAQERRPVRAAPEAALARLPAPDTAPEPGAAPGPVAAPNEAAVPDVHAASPAALQASAPPPAATASSASAAPAPPPVRLAAKAVTTQPVSAATQASTSTPAVPAPTAAASAAPTIAAPAAPAQSALSLAVAPEPESAAPASALPAPGSRWRDGTYTGWGTSRHGDIKAQVVIRDGRIVDAGIASCETRYPCDVISHIIAQPVARQSPDVDAVSRATESADAYYFGLVEALKEAQLPPAGESAAQP